MTTGMAEGFRQVFKASLPQIRYAFAYGSAVQQQAGYDADRTARAMVDLMLVVRDSAAFHRANLESNPGHYSWLMRTAQEGLRQRVQNSGAGVFFNTKVPFAGRRAKYGIVEEGVFVNDCLHWDTLYVAGRLHKPVSAIDGCFWSK